MAYARIASLAFVLVLAFSPFFGAITNDQTDSPQDRTPTINPIHELNLFTLNKFPISVDTVNACGDNADAETRIYCALKDAIPGLLDQSKGAVNVKVRIGSADLQTISRTPKPLHLVKDANTAETYAFDSDGTDYNAIFLDQGTLYVFVGEPSADVAVAIIRHLMDESYTFSLNSQCILRTAANAKAMAFKNCQVLDAKKTSLGKLEYRKIQCEKPAKTGIIGLAAAINGQCLATVPGTGATALTEPETSSPSRESTTTECSAANFVSPIDNPQPRVDPQGDYWWGSTRNTADHHEGLDIKGQDGVTAVKAAGAGTVESYKTDQCGTGLMINHGCTINGKIFRTKYCHLSTKKALPAAGTKVTQAQVIGLMGRTGNIQTGMVTHLHVEYMAGGRYEGPVFKSGDFDPVEKGFMPKNFGVPGKQYTETLEPDANLNFAEKETLMTVSEYTQYSLPKGEFITPNPRCTSSNDDANGFFGYRNRQIGSGCVHAGLDIRGKVKSGGGNIYTSPVRAMMSGTIVRINEDFQKVGKMDYSIVVKSGTWLISYGHITLGKNPATDKPYKVGDAVKKGQTLGLPHPKIQQGYGGEVDVKILYTGSEQKLNALTIKELKKNSKYKSLFDQYDTNKILQSSDFTFGVSNYDDYFLWEAYTADLKPLTATESSASTPQDATTPNNVPAATSSIPVSSDAKPMSDVCVYYYLDSKDGAKDAFYDAGIAAYAGPGGACLVGRAALSRSDIQYPSGYNGYVNVNELPEADSYEGCYVAKIPLQKHGDQQPAGVNVKLFLSKNKETFAASEGYLEKGIARTLSDEKTIGTLTCLPPVAVKTKPADTAAAGRQFLQYAMELSGAAYTMEPWRYQTPKKGIDCAGVVTYAFGRMLESGYRLPPEFYAEMKKTKFTTKTGTTVGHPVQGISGNAGYLSKILFTDIKVPTNVNVPYPYLSDVWGGLLEAGGWEVPIDQAQPGDVAVWSFTDGGQCKGAFSEANPWQPVKDFCWRGEGHIEVVHSRSGNKITTFGSGSTNPPVPARVKPDRTGIYKVFRIPWIASGGNAPAGAATAAAGGCTDAGLAAKLAQYGLKIETSIGGKSTQRDLSEWKPEITAYSQRHYNEPVATADLTPITIVQHYTVSTSFAWNLVTDKADNAGEKPGYASHFEVDGKNIYQILPINVRSRGAFGINHKAINIEMVAMDANDLARRGTTLDTDAKLTAALMAQCNIPLEKVYSHQQLNDGKKGVPEYDDKTYADYGDQRKSDPGEDNMKTIKDKIRAMGALTPVIVGGSVRSAGQANPSKATARDIDGLRLAERASCAPPKLAAFEEQNSEWIIEYANQEGIDPVGLAYSLMQESNCEHFSSAGKVKTSLGRAQGPNIPVGIAQMKPNTGAGITVTVGGQQRTCRDYVARADPAGVETSIACAARYYKQLLSLPRVGGKWQNAWAAYNAGPNGDWNNGETKAYVSRLTQAYQGAVAQLG